MAFVHRKRAKPSDNSVTHRQQSSEGLGESSDGGGRARRASTKAPIVEDINSYDEEDSEGDYQAEVEASVETGFVADDDDEIEESSSPGEHPIPSGQNVANIPVNDRTGCFVSRIRMWLRLSLAWTRGSATCISTGCFMSY